MLYRYRIRTQHHMLLRLHLLIMLYRGLMFYRTILTYSALERNTLYIHYVVYFDHCDFDLVHIDRLRETLKLNENMYLKKSASCCSICKRVTELERRMAAVATAGGGRQIDCITADNRDEEDESRDAAAPLPGQNKRTGAIIIEQAPSKWPTRYAVIRLCDCHIFRGLYFKQYRHNRRYHHYHHHHLFIYLLKHNKNT